VLFGANLLIIFYFVTATEEPVPAPMVEPAPLAGELRLLNELSQDQMAALTGGNEPEEAAVETDTGLVCRLWGPFTSDSELQQIRAAVGVVGEVIEVRTKEIESAPDYLVYLESDNNFDNARRLKQELESLAIEAYVMSGGAYINSVSAGVFSSQQRGNRQMQRLVDLGYTPKIAALQRLQAVHYLAGQVPREFELPDQSADDCAAIASAR